MNSLQSLRELPVQPRFSLASESNPPSGAKHVPVASDDATTRRLTGLLLPYSTYQYV
jgi:hypothetical protein